MKTLSKLTTILFATTTLFSCLGETSTTDSAKIGKISSDKGLNIVTGQVVTFKIPITVNKPASELDQIYWSKEDPASLFSEALHAGEFNGNNSSFSTSWSTVGTYKIGFEYRYIINNETFYKKDSCYVNVFKSHFLNCLIGQTKKSVLEENPDLTPLPNDGNCYYRSTNDATYYFAFSSSALVSGTQIEVKTSNIEGAAYGYLTKKYAIDDKKNLDQSTLKFSVSYRDGYKPTQKVLDAVTEFEAGTNLTKTEHKNVISNAVLSKDIVSLNVYALLASDSKICTTISVSADNNSSNTYNITSVTKGL
ncbi:MAG: hypothetical protein R3Y26_03590 [Rikenellaceae bacterium]